jgi:hypothetical protein
MQNNFEMTKRSLIESFPLPIAAFKAKSAMPVILAKKFLEGVKVGPRYAVTGLHANRSIRGNDIVKSVERLKSP